VPNDIGVGKIRNFHPISRRISETVQDRTESYYTNDYFFCFLLLPLGEIKMCNRKSHMGFRLVPKSSTLDELELL